jgi:hypothetical protein
MADVNVQQPKGTKKKRPHAPRNYQLPGGVWRYGRSAIYQRRRNYLKKNLNKDKKVKKRVHYKIKPIGGEKNGGTRLILTRKSVRLPYKVVDCSDLEEVVSLGGHAQTVA